MQRELNRRWRGKDSATNVLSFPAQDFEAGPVSMPPRRLSLPLGDVVLAFETVAAEAAAQGKSLDDHAAHLIVHGILHLLGLDHAAEEEAEAMEAMERAALAALGIADPYLPRVPLAEAAHG
jgi:probable rRNA maturation factor